MNRLCTTPALHHGRRIQRKHTDVIGTVTDNSDFTKFNTGGSVDHVKLLGTAAAR